MIVYCTHIATALYIDVAAWCVMASQPGGQLSEALLAQVSLLAGPHTTFITAVGVPALPVTLQYYAILTFGGDGGTFTRVPYGAHHSRLHSHVVPGTCLRYYDWTLVVPAVVLRFHTVPALLLRFYSPPLRFPFTTPKRRKKKKKIIYYM